MKRTLSVLSGIVLAAVAGCCWDHPDYSNGNGPIRTFLGIGQGTVQQAPETGADCPVCHRGSLCQRGQEGGDQEAGPETAGVAYPYYTLHGPRDYFDRNPNSLGP